VYGHLNGAHLHVATYDRTTGGFSPSSSKITNASSVGYCVIKSGYEIKQFNKKKKNIQQPY
jgi:hypothetical protein